MLEFYLFILIFNVKSFLVIAHMSRKYRQIRKATKYISLLNVKLLTSAVQHACITE